MPGLPAACVLVFHLVKAVTEHVLAPLGSSILGRIIKLAAQYLFLLSTLREALKGSSAWRLFFVVRAFC